MPDVETTLVWKLRDEVSATAKRIDDRLHKLGIKTKGTTGIMGNLGKATGGLVTPLTLTAGAAGLAAAGILELLQNAKEDEVRHTRLTQVLKENAKSFDGNRAALDAYMDSQEKLGFNSDEVEDSLTRLIVATGDVGKAQALQATAMDLARLKGIDLADATDRLVRLNGGNLRGIKELGIELPKGADKVKALAAVQGVAAGQATEYAATTEGAGERIRAKFANIADKIGAVLLPKMKELVSFVADELIPWFEGAWAEVEKFGNKIDELAGQVGKAIADVQKLLGLEGAFRTTPGGIQNSEDFLHQINFPGHNAAGGWVGLHGPELSWLGEKGPEYVMSNDQVRGGGMGGIAPHTHPIYIDGRQTWTALTPYAAAEYSRTPGR